MGFIMGSLVFLMEKTGFTLAEPARLLLTVGFLGGFTTFSSFSLETVTLIEGGSLFYAAMSRRLLSCRPPSFATACCT